MLAATGCARRPRAAARIRRDHPRIGLAPARRREHAARHVEDRVRQFRLRPGALRDRAAGARLLRPHAAQGRAGRARAHPRHRAGSAGARRRPARLPADPDQPPLQRREVHAAAAASSRVCRAAPARPHRARRGGHRHRHRAKQDLPRLGDPFFQAGSAYSRSHDGTGLGLSVVRGLVGLHRGELTIESAPGEGTAVTVSLPIDCRGGRRAGRGRAGARAVRAARRTANCSRGE